MKTTNVTSYLKSKLEIPWNGASLASQLTTVKEFLDSLLPLYEYLDPPLRAEILFALLQVKKRELLSGPLGKLIAIESRIQKDALANQPKEGIGRDSGIQAEWVSFLLVLVQQYSETGKFDINALTSVETCNSLFAEVYESICTQVNDMNIDDTTRNSLWGQELPYLDIDPKSTINNGPSLKVKDPAALQESRKERLNLIDQLYMPKTGNSMTASSLPSLVSAKRRAVVGGGGGADGFGILGNNSSSSPTSPVSSMGFLRSTSKASPGGPTASGSRPLIMGGLKKNNINNASTPTSKLIMMPPKPAKSAVVLIDDMESTSIMMGRVESKKQEKLELQREAELERQRKRKEAEEKKLARQAQVEARKKEREEKKNATKMMISPSTVESPSSSPTSTPKKAKIEEPATSPINPTATGDSLNPELQKLMGVLFENSDNSLDPESKSQIIDFIGGKREKQNPNDDDIRQIVMNQSQVMNGDTPVIEYILFEMNYASGEWRKLRRKRPLNNNNQ